MGWHDLRRGYPLKSLKSKEACENRAAALDKGADKLEHDAQEKESNKNIALGTSKTNYLDPRITVAFCKRSGLEISKVFTKSHLKKFPWAMDAGAEYVFDGESGMAAAEG